MPGVRDIKRRIRSVKNIQQITKAMQMVSAAKLRKTQGAVVGSRPYAAKMSEILGRIVASVQDATHPLLDQRPVRSVGIILITADRGMAAGYNANLIRKAMVEAARCGDSGDKIGNDLVEVSFIAVGRKGRDFLKRRQKRIFQEVTGINDTPSFVEAQQIARMAIDRYLDGTFDQIKVIYQEFVSALQQQPVIKQLLPIPREKGGGAKDGATADRDYLYEPEPQRVLEILLPKYVNNLLFQALMEAKASEHGARMTAMRAATDNAGEIIDKYTLFFNRARQAAITREISEIVGGANALQAQ